MGQLLDNFNNFSDDQRKYCNEQVAESGDPLIVAIEPGTLTAPEESDVDNWIIDYKNASQSEKDELVGSGHQAREAQL